MEENEGEQVRKGENTDKGKKKKAKERRRKEEKWKNKNRKKRSLENTQHKTVPEEGADEPSTGKGTYHLISTH